MKLRLRTFLFSFQTKLVIAFALVIMIAIFLAGAVFVVRQRDERRQHALDHVAAASPAIYQQALFALQPQEENERPFNDVLDSLATDQKVRILLVSNDGIVLHDTGGHFDGFLVNVPPSSEEDVRRGFLAWEPTGDVNERGLTFVSASTGLTLRRPLPFRIILAVQSDTIASAWRGVLPGLGIAALIAVPLAMLAGMVLARQVAQPVRRLTAASEAMAGGDYSQRVELDREDEIGRLARSFSVMAQRTGERDAQMRALLANVSHDLKTPMTSITGYAQALTDGTADPQESGRIGEVIKSEAEHVNRLLADLLYLGEIDAGQVITRREDIPLEDLVERSLRHIEPQAAARDINLNVDVAPEVTLHNVDPDKLERAFTNVLENAAKFSPEGGDVTVTGAVENGIAPPHVVFDVTNSGPPIPEEDLPRVFDRFFRGDRSRRAASGSGLGLAITRELVELNAGTIEARNGDGTVTFRITLPGDTA